MATDNPFVSMSFAAESAVTAGSADPILILRRFFVTDQTSDATEEAKNNISPFRSAMMNPHSNADRRKTACMR